MKHKFLTRMAAFTLGLAMAVGVSVGVANNRNTKAVYATAGDVTWNRVTSISTLLAGGTFILGHEATANSGIIIPMANTGSATTSAAGFMYTGSSASSGGTGTINMATVASTASFEVTIGESTAVENAIYIKVGNNYIGNTNTKNNCKLFASQSETTSFVPTMLTNDKVSLVIDANATYTHLQYNTGSPRFAVYGNSQQNPVIYQKIIEQGITGSSSAFVDETVSLTSNATSTVSWSIVAADTTAAGATITNVGVVSVTGAGTVKVKAVASGYTDATHVITFNERPAGTYYTVTFDSDGGSVSPANMSIAEGETFEFPSPGTKEHYSFDGWTSDANTFYDPGDTSPAVVADIDYYGFWTEDPKYTVTYSSGSNGSGSFADGTYYGGEYTLLPFGSLTGVSASEGYRFKNYTVGGIDKNPGDTITLSSNTSVTVNFEEIPMAYEIAFGSTKNTNPTELTTSTFLSVYSVDGDVSCTSISKVYGISTSRLKMGTKNDPARLTLGIPSNKYFTKVEAIVSDGADIDFEVQSGASGSTKESQNISTADTYVFDDYLVSEESNVVTITTSAAGAIYLTGLNLYYGLKAPEITANPSSITLHDGGVEEVEITVANYASVPTLECNIQSGATSIASATVGAVNGSNKATATITATTVSGDAVVRVRDSANPSAYYVDINVTVESVVGIIEDIDTTSSLAYHYSRTGAVVDTLDRAFTGLGNDDGYTAWSDKAGSSGAVYAGYSYGRATTNIQLRTSDNTSGIITTASGGRAKKVTVAWSEGTTEGKTLDVYGKNSAYTGTTELYNIESAGTLIGSIVCGTSTILYINDDYEYIGLRSNTGGMNIDSINIQWGAYTYSYPTIAMRFGATINEDLWDALDTNSNLISGFGVMIKATDSSFSIKNNYASAVAAGESPDYENTLVDYYMGISPEFPPKSGSNYVWNLFLSVDYTDRNVNYEAAAYIKVGDNYVFFKQTGFSVVTLAQDYLQNRGCNNETAGGSLKNLSLQ